MNQSPRLRRALKRQLLIASSLAAVLISGLISALAQSKPIEDSLYTASLQHVTRFRVCLPSLDGGSGRYPVLLLLHGFSGNFRNWTDQANVQKYAGLDSVVIVTPDGDNSWYVNSFTDTSARFEDAYVNELLPYVNRKYPVDDRFVGIAGMSMGGYGALTIGLRHPDRFRFIGAISASLDIPFGISDLGQNDRAGFRASLERAFGKDTAGWAAVTVQRIAAHIDTARVPYIYLVNGIQDEFVLRLSLYRAFADILRGRGIRYEYHETPGRHTMSYGAREIGPLIQRFKELCARRWD
jgi:S-formylglutathione hydrolase FrmB